MSDSHQKLRSRYLSFWLNVTKEMPMATLEMHGNTTVQGKLCGTDSQNNRFRIDQLESPIGVYDHVVVRGSDSIQLASTVAGHGD
ncbi:hypothetical protein J3Q64DRAFT_1851539 [Phycomyces blakesleeanus]|uniref:LSM domain-containing protein n=1 Tax=Phycomyces blakesleeanus TaxID=4837 RepID=A0ABR3AR25_PHYBL